MGHAWLPHPQLQITVTHSAVNYVLEAVSTVVRRHENGFDTGTVLLEDTQARNYVDKVTADDVIEIKQKDKSDASWTTILKGVIRRVEPMLSMNGNFLNVECDGAGYGLAVTSCGEEYGSESSNSSMDTIKEIIESAGGIIDSWVNEVLNSGVTSGYSYWVSVEDIAGSIKYLYFPYKPCSKAINDICDVVQAIKGTNAGPHWICTTDSRVIVSTVGNHVSPQSTYWPTWWLWNAGDTEQESRDRATVTEGEDFVNFRFQHLSKEANYILYHGRFQRPMDGDRWTNNNSGDWGGGTVADDSGTKKVGTHSIKLTCPATSSEQWFYPDVTSTELGWDVGNFGGKYNIPVLDFWIMRDGNEAATYPWIAMSSYGGGAWTGHWHYWLGDQMASANTWYHFTLPIGPYGFPSQLRGARDWYPDGVLGGDWTEIDAVRFNTTVSGGTPSDCWVDGLHVSGWVLRGARQSAAYSSSDPLKLKTITDEVAKDDSLVASDDSGLMGRLCYAEYLRQSSTPIVGTYTTPITNDLLPGQLVHIHAKKKSGGSFRIDDDFRAMRVVHTISDQGFLTVVDVTDDLKNANPRPLPTQLNVLLGAVRPEFQDRQATSIKTREIDITQPILEKSY